MQMLADKSATPTACCARFTSCTDCLPPRSQAGAACGAGPGSSAVHHGPARLPALHHHDLPDAGGWRGGLCGIQVAGCVSMQAAFGKRTSIGRLRLTLSLSPHTLTTADGPLPREPVPPAGLHGAERRALLPADLRLAGAVLLCRHALGQHLGAAPVCGSHSRCGAGCMAGRGCLGAFQRGWKESNGPENLHSGCPDAQPAFVLTHSARPTQAAVPLPLCAACVAAGALIAFIFPAWIALRAIRCRDPSALASQV